MMDLNIVLSVLVVAVYAFIGGVLAGSGTQGNLRPLMTGRFPWASLVSVLMLCMAFWPISLLIRSCKK